MKIESLQCSTAYSAAHRCKAPRTKIWGKIYTWIALLPTLFIAVNGQIRPESGPVAFRFTAMEDDSFDRKLLRLGCSLLMMILVFSQLPKVLDRAWHAKGPIALCGVALISAAWSQNPAHTIVDAANLLFTTLFAVYITVRYEREMLLSFLMLLSASCLALSLAAVVAFPNIGIDPFQNFAWRGIFGQRNNCAVVCSLFLMIALHYRATDGVSRAARMFVLSASTLLIVMSGSRTGWALSGAGVALYCGVRLIMRLAGRERILFLMGLSVPILTLTLYVANNLNRVLLLLDKDPTMSQRTIIWATVIPSILKHPILGYGYGGFWTGLNGESMQAILTTGWMEAQAQNGFLDLLLQIGVVGLLILMAVLFKATRRGVAAIFGREQCPEIRFAIALLPIVLLANIGESSILLPLGLPWFLALVCFMLLGQPTSTGEPI